MIRRRGFTLIELLVVIGIIVLLAAIAIVVGGGIQHRAARAKQIELIRRIEVALTGYHTEFNQYPPSMGESSRPLPMYLARKLEVLDRTGRVQKIIEPLMSFSRNELNTSGEVIDVYRRPMRYRNPGRDHSAEGGRDNRTFVDIWCVPGPEWGKMGPPCNWRMQ